MVTRGENVTTLFDAPTSELMPAAECTADFDEVCARLGASPNVNYIRYDKIKKPPKRYRWVGMKLDSGRFAEIAKTDEDATFTIELQRRGYGFYIRDVDEVRRFIGVGEMEVRRLDNGLKWIETNSSSSVGA